MNNIDIQYQKLCKEILDYGFEKNTRNGKVLSIFGATIRHNMGDGFPLLTTKKMAWKTIVTELLWFLRGDTNLKFLVDNGCHIWDGDAYKAYLKKRTTANKDNVREPHTLANGMTGQISRAFTKEEFINKIKTDDEFAKKWGELGPIYGKQWRSWEINEPKEILRTENVTWPYEPNPHTYQQRVGTFKIKQIDQISNLINDLKTNPDSRRLMVSAWNVDELDQMVLPPCHYGFQVYTRELSDEERLSWMKKNKSNVVLPMRDPSVEFSMDEWFRPYGVPKRAISLMWNQRSVDVPLGLPFNIASYGLLLEIIAKTVNMVPEMLIGNLGDCHIYENQIDGIKEQMGRELSLEERYVLYFERLDPTMVPLDIKVPNIHQYFTELNIPKRTREPYPLPTLNINTEFWNHEYQTIDGYIKSMEIGDFQVENYQSHPAIKMPLSN